MPRRSSGPRLWWRRGQWSIAWSDGHGGTNERRTGTTDRQQAEAALAEFLVSRRERPRGPRPVDQYWVADLLSDYAEEHAVHTAGRETVGYNMVRLLDYFGQSTAAEITKASCQGYAKHRRNSKISDNTIRREIAVLSSATGHAVSEGRLTQRPVIWMPKQGPGKERWLTRSEVARLLNAARKDPQSRTHLPLFIMLAVYGGARAGAIYGLTWDQVDLTRGRIDWNPTGRTKTTKRRSRIPIPRRLLTFLRLASRRTPRIGPVLTFNGKPIKSVKKSFATACRNAGLIAPTNDTDEKGNVIYKVDVSPHTLRHTCGTWQAQKGVPLWEIAGYLGHTMSRTTELYAHHHPDYMEGSVRALEDNYTADNTASPRSKGA